MIINVDLNLSGTNNATIVINGEHYCVCMSAVVIFQVPHITSHIVIVRAALTTLNNLMVAPMYGSQTTDIKAQREIVDRHITKLRTIVENIANDPAIADDARVGIVQSAGMEVKGFTKRQKDHFEVKNGEISGDVLLKAQGNVDAHEWTYTADVINHSDIIHLDATTAANTTKSGLIKGREYSFFHRPITPNGPHPWEGPENIIIL